jgi:hypothetical protein
VNEAKTNKQQKGYVKYLLDSWTAASTGQHYMKLTLFFGASCWQFIAPVVSVRLHGDLDGSTCASSCASVVGTNDQIVGHRTSLDWGVKN